MGSSWSSGRDYFRMIGRKCPLLRLPVPALRLFCLGTDSEWQRLGRCSLTCYSLNSLLSWFFKINHLYCYKWHRTWSLWTMKATATKSMCLVCENKLNQFNSENIYNICHISKKKFSSWFSLQPVQYLQRSCLRLFRFYQPKLKLLNES